jgi:CyaY protein
VDTPLSESDFRIAADEALEDLEQALLPLADSLDIELDRRNGVLEIVFESPAPTKFIVSPNAPVRQIWVSAMGRSYKLSWSASAETFELERESLADLLSRLVRQYADA